MKKPAFGRSAESGFDGFGRKGAGDARSSSDGLRPSFVGASKFLIGIMNFEDAQLLAPPRQLRRQNFVFSDEAAPRLICCGVDEAAPIFL